jgi:hypothetical protein
MKRPTVITTPIPTPEETAKLLGIPKKDVRRLEALVDKLAQSPAAARQFGEPLNGHDSPGKRKKSAAKREPRGNGHR